MKLPNKEIHVVTPFQGIDADTAPDLLSNKKARWKKNCEGSLNNGLNGMTGKDTPTKSLVTNFTPSQYLPSTRTLEIAFNGIAFPAYVWGYTKDGTETVLNFPVPDAATLDTLMLSIGWTKVATNVYQITTTELWQYFGYKNGTAGFQFSQPVTVVSRGTLTGINYCTGFHYERIINQFYWWNYNTAGRHQIQMYDGNTNTYATVTETPLLNLSLDFRISSTDLVIINNIQDGSTNYLLYWVDNFNSNRKVNIQRCLSGDYFKNFPLNYLIPAQWMNNETYPSFGNVTGTLQLDSTFQENYIANNNFQLCYYFGYDDGETSTLSDYSSLYYTTDYLNPPFSSMPNYIQVSNISAGGENVYFVVPCFRVGNTGDWNALSPIYRKDIINNATYNAITNTFSFNFYNNQTYTNVQANTVNNNYSLVPIRCGAQRFLANNILLYGDITEGYNNLTAAQRAVPTISISYTQIANASLHITGQVVVNITFGSPVTGSVQFQLKHRANATGVITVIDQDGATFVNIVPSGFTWNIDKTVSPINIYDTIYIEVTTLTAGMAAITTVGSSTLNGAYSGVTPVNNGNFNVTSTVPQTPILGQNILFPNVVSDPQGTWNVATGVHTDPNNVAPNGTAHLKQGGNYKIGFVLYDYLNRSTFVQASPQLVLVIKTVMELGFNASQTITWFWNNLVFPDWVKKVSVCRTQNLYCQHVGGIGQQEFIQWQTNTAAFLDGQNNVAFPSSTATKIELSMISLGTFNSNNNQQTTTQYTYTAGDLVRFITVGGVLQSTIIEKQLRGVTGSLDSFYVDMDSALVNLEAGDLMEIRTPLAVPSADIYYEITDLMPTTGTIGNNKAVTQTFTINTFDTYFVNRNGIIVIPSTANAHIGLFESPYRSDLILNSWGEDIGLGRAQVVNNNAAQFEHSDIIRFSLAYVIGTLVNGLSTFLSANVINVNTNFGSITYFVNIKNVLHIIQEDNVTYSLIAQSITFLQNGVPQILTGDEVISKPQDTLGDFGCQDPETVVFRDNKVFFWDLKRGVIVEYNTEYSAYKKPFQNAISRNGLTSYYLLESEFIRANRHSGINRLQLHGGIDPKRNKYYVTSFRPLAFGNPYVDTASQMTVQDKGTYALNFGGEASYFEGAYGFIPEFYGYMDAGQSGDLMISFSQGIPYLHNSNLALDYLNFYGDTTDTQYIEVAINKTSQSTNNEYAVNRHFYTSVMNFYSVGMDSKQPATYGTAPRYEGIFVSTSNGQQSSIPIGYAQWREGFYWYNVLRSTSTGKTIHTGEPLKGTNMTIRWKRDADPSVQNQYNEVGTFVFVVNESAATI